MIKFTLKDIRDAVAKSIPGHRVGLATRDREFDAGDWTCLGCRARSIELYNIDVDGQEYSVSVCCQCGRVAWAMFPARAHMDGLPENQVIGRVGQQ